MRPIEWLKTNQPALALILSLASFVVALGSLAVVVFREFIQGPRLDAKITQVNLMRLGDGGKTELLVEMLADDLLSPLPTPSARTVSTAHPSITAARDREHLLIAIRDAARTARVAYDPPVDLIKRYIGHRSFFPSFYVPLIVTNTGARVGHVASLVLVVTDTTTPTSRWAFPAFVEVNVPVLLDRTRPHNDIERTKGIFSGLAVPPRGSVSTDPLFLPQHDASNTIISRQNLPPGSYTFAVFGYSPDNVLLFRTQAIKYELKADRLVEMFKGSDSVDFVLLEKHIADAVSR
ncbi:MAG: hypothetical protein EPO35_00240 [Acidobacteria bacterium]|nr:MAG: hypothetical protein EPO35_00240 [Acidobacteriota bacterium]